MGIAEQRLRFRGKQERRLARAYPDAHLAYYASERRAAAEGVDASWRGPGWYLWRGVEIDRYLAPRQAGCRMAVTQLLIDEGVVVGPWDVAEAVLQVTAAIGAAVVAAWVGGRSE